MIPLKRFIRTHGLSMTAELADRNPNMDVMPAGSRHWLCTLTHEPSGRTMEIHFSQGPAIEREPDIEDVLDCLAMEAAGYENARDFEDWCAEYGYNDDSRRAERIYHTVAGQVKQLRRLVPSGFEALLWNVERP